MTWLPRLTRGAGMTSLTGRIRMGRLYRLTVIPRLARFPRLAAMTGTPRPTRLTRMIRPPELTRLTGTTSMARETRLPRMRNTYGGPGLLWPGRVWSLFWSSRWFRGCLVLAFSFFSQPGPRDIWGAPTQTGPLSWNTQNHRQNRLGCAKPTTETVEQVELEI